MDGPGMSLFNGAGSIHINNSFGRLEEEEALKEERLRKEEIHNELKERFDDFEDDEEDTVNDSAHFGSINNTSQYHTRNTSTDKASNLHDELIQSERKGGAYSSVGQGDGGAQHNGRHNNTNNGHYQHCYSYDNIHDTNFTSHRKNDNQLELILEVKCREVQKLTDELSKCRKESSTAHEELYGRLAVAEAERERAQLSLQQSKQLIENSKHRITDLEHEVTSLKQKIIAVNLKNEELNAEVTAVTASLMDTQSRLQVAQLNKEAAHNTDAIFKALHDRHNEEVECLEKDLRKSIKKLQEKENDYNLLEKRYKDIEHSKEALLIEKGSTINQLAMELKETQDRLADMGERINKFISERDTAKLQCKDLAHKFEETAKELVEYRTKYIRLQKEQSELDEVLSKVTDFQDMDVCIQLHGDRQVNRFSAQADKVDILYNELNNRILEMNAKEEQIERLNEAIKQKDLLIDQQKENEAILRFEIESLKSKELRISDEIKQLNEKLDLSNSMDSSYRSKYFDLETEFKKIKAEYNSLLSKHTSLELKYEEINSAMNHKNIQENVSGKEWIKEKENVSGKEWIKEKENVSGKEWIKEKEKLNYQLKDAQKQVEDFKNLYIEICGERDKLSKEISEIKLNNPQQDVRLDRAEVENLKNLLDSEKKKVEKLQKALLELQQNEFDNHIKNFKKSMDNKVAMDGMENTNECHVEEIKKLKNEYDNLQRTCNEQMTKLNDLNKELDESKNVISKLKIENELHAERDRLIADLKEKGKQFEKYIENQKNKVINRREVGTITEESSTVTNILNTSPNQVNNTKTEELIRNEIAQQFAIEMKKMQNQFINHISGMEEEYKGNITKLGDVLKLKTKEVASLQEVILSERNRYKQYVLQLEECQNTNANNEKVLAEYKTNVEKYKQALQKLHQEFKELKQHKDSYNEERQKMTLKELDKIKGKYTSVKKLLTKYYEYSAVKDKHVEKELSKMKSLYEGKLKIMQEKLQNCLKESESKIQNSNSTDNFHNTEVHKSASSERKQLS